jgi:phosphate acyltransferase
MLPVALDAMGGDIGMPVNVDGALAAIREDAAKVILVGDESLLRKEIAQQQGAGLLDNGTLVLRHAPEVVAMDEKPGVALRKKKQSSMRVVCDLVKSKEACAALSAGNSGAMMAVALFVLGRLPGVMRPCIATFFPSNNAIGSSILVDAGANVDCTAHHLLQFAIMAEVYARYHFDIESPSIGIISNGSEDSKGTDLTRAAYQLLEQTDLNFVGYAEGASLGTGEPTIAVTDGFTGNIMLKTAEGVQHFFIQQIREGYEKGGFLTKLGGALSRSLFKRIKEQFDPREYGAAPLLGISAPAYIAHGKSDAYTIRRAIAIASRHASQNLAHQIEAGINRSLDLLDKDKSSTEAAS